MIDIQLRVLKRAVVEPKGVCLFAMARDEMYFLPHFFDYYRSLGVSSFAIYDDNSTDGSLEFLLRQPDCIVIQGNHEFKTPCGFDATGVPRRFTEVLREAAPQSFFPNQWTLVMDLDEFIVLPQAFSNLPSYCEHLERRGQFSAWGSLVDVYERTLNHRNYSWSESPLDREFYFDRGPYLVCDERGMMKSTFKGIRPRLLEQLAVRFPAEIHDIFGDRLLVAQPNKAPLIKHGMNIKRVGHHRTDAPPSSLDDCAILHFKFIPATDQRIAYALATEGYAFKSVEYKFLRLAIDKLGDESLIHADSRLYTGPASLTEAGLLVSGFSEVEAQRRFA